jgi:IS30 family transposase
MCEIKTNFKDYTNQQIEGINQEINNRPRKALKFDSPIQNLTKNKIAFQS